MLLYSKKLLINKCLIGSCYFVHTFLGLSAAFVQRVYHIAVCFWCNCNFFFVDKFVKYVRQMFIRFYVECSVSAMSF